MSKLPFRTLTVTSGRDVIGSIKQKGQGNFIALLPSGRSLGSFPTAATAAQAINANRVVKLADASEGSAN
jgi:hypothetical protein